MARLFTDSFDHYNTSQILNKWSYGNIAYTSIVSGMVGATGSCICVSNGQTVVKNVGLNATTLSCGARVRIDNMTWMFPLVVFGDAGTTQLLVTSNAAGAIVVYQGANYNTLNGTMLGMSTQINLISAQNWAYVEAQATFTTNATGSVTVKVNSQTVLTLTNVQTTSTGNAYANQIWLYTVNGNSNEYFDDVYVNDNSGSCYTGFDGDQRIVCVYPAGAG